MHAWNTWLSCQAYTQKPICSMETAWRDETLKRIQNNHRAAWKSCWRTGLLHAGTKYVISTMCVYLFCLCLLALHLQVEHSETLGIYQSGSVNIKGQMSLAAFFHWSTFTETLQDYPVWQSLAPPSLLPAARTKRHLRHVDGEENSQHSVRCHRSPVSESLWQAERRTVFTHSLWGIQDAVQELVHGWKRWPAAHADLIG